MVGLRTERSSPPSRAQPSKLAPQWLSYLNNTTTRKLQHRFLLVCESDCPLLPWPQLPQDWLCAHC